MESMSALGQYMFGDFLWQYTMNDLYTDEEKKDLYDMLISHQHVSSIFHLVMYYYPGYIAQSDLSKRAYNLLRKSLDQMPLYVNDENYEARIVAVWRLKWAK
jgi:hypothetical protein